ncbi:T9SS type A sorting domain-containing protein [Dyadobacter sp. LHD-138]|uniref:T9SS type A sorting domain-containing protein n=1 Tax=Dyadobacter sp. LHD-138 TaxID=3071413 RepID=UPI0027E1BBE1|nr:T9SS type A sorting domain-containing protein [Dyadobacter sp. LHD-138]MDQ6482052.1 T9SS type A sorting domain-containing protein [Dyadobacter sp. LHD-138]
MQLNNKIYKPARWLGCAVGLLVGTVAFAQSTTIGGDKDPLILDAGYASDYSPDGLFILENGSMTLQNKSTYEHGNTVMNNLGNWTSLSGSMDLFLARGLNTISGTLAPNFYNGNFNNGPEITAITNNNGINVANHLDFNNGLTTTIRSNHATGAIHFADNATYTHSSLGDAQYVNGYVSKTGNDAFVYPVGNQTGADLRTLTISAPSLPADELSIAYWQGDVGTTLDPTGGAHARTSLNTAGTAGISKLESVSPIGFWDWIPVSGTSSLTVSVSIPDFSGLHGYVPADIRLVGWNTVTNQWDNLSGSSGAATNSEGSIVTGTVSNMSSYSAIAIGAISLPLPVKLVRFTANAEGEVSQLYWETSEEINSERFEIERSINAKDWIVIGVKSAIGESKKIVNYHYTDESPAPVTNYYRLKMVDRDLSFAYSRIQSVILNALSKSVIIFPNPVSDVIYLKNANNTLVTEISVLDTKGTTVYQSNVLPSEGINVELLKNGIYMLRINKADGTTNTTKVLINR